MSVVNNNLLLAGDDGYVIDRSVRLRSSASAYFNRTPASAGNRKTWTWSGWVKRGALANQDLFSAYQNADNQTLISFSSDTLIVYTIHGGGAFDYGFQTTAVFRDPSAWYHVVAVFDSANATAANRAAVYVNGVKQTGSMAFGDIPLDQDGIVNSTNAHSIGRRGSGSQYFDGYLTEVNFIDGQALTPTSFGETDAVTGVWKPKKYAGTYGTNGFYLNFSDPSAATAAAIGKDNSGNGNNWTPNNISVTAGVTYDSMIDTPTPVTDVRGNFAVLNPLVSSSYQNITQGNLTTFSNTATDSGLAVATMGASSGKFYWEATVSGGSSGYPIIGALRNIPASGNGLVPGSSTTGGFAYYANLGIIQKEGSSITTVATSTTNDIVGFALDIDNLQVEIYKNNTLLYTLTGLTAGTYFPATGTYNSTGVYHNFGQRPFAYTPPSGFKALHTGNLPEPTIVDGGEYFNTVLYTGNGSTNNVTGVGFQPDFVWLKARSAGGFDHVLQDVIRGSTRQLYTNTTGAEVDDTDAVTSFNADGFTSGADVTTNNSGTTFVAWNWKANGAGVSNTAGSITSTVSAGVTQGFSVVTYTGTGANATVGHGLGVAPSMVIVKRRDTTADWDIWHTGIGDGTKYMVFTTQAVLTATNIWNSTTPASSVFSVGTHASVNASSGTYVAYCFAEVPGYSRFGSYTGNGSADGPFVFCGFRPAFVLLKATNNPAGSYSWFMFDSERQTYNVIGPQLFANLSNAESSFAEIDFLSNGFKMRGTSLTTNESGLSFIYAAFAENPFKYALAR